MFREDLLEKHEKLQFNILKKIFITNGNVTKEYLCKFFNISLPTLRSNLNKLSYLLEIVYYEDVKLIISREKIILKYNKQVNLDSILFYLINNSLKLKLLKYIYFNNFNDINGIKLCKEFSISLSTLNRKIVECNYILKEFNISIKNYKLNGCIMQITYFYYSLFTNLNINLYFKSQILCKLSLYLEKYFNISLDKISEYKLQNLLIILDNIVNKKHNYLTAFHKNNIKLIKKNDFFYNLVCFFNKNNFSLKKSELFSYSILTFIYSYEILNYKTIKKINCTIHIPNNNYKVILKNIKSIYTCSTIFLNDKIKLNLLNLCHKQYFFKGVFYSNDKIIINYYIEKFSSYFRVNFIEMLLKTIYSKNNSKFLLDEDYFRICILLILVNIKKAKFQIYIGLAYNNDFFNLLPNMKNTLNFLYEKFDVFLEEYNYNSQYDLVITNLNYNFLSKNYNYIYLITNLGIEHDIYNLSTLLNKIERNKIKETIYDFNITKYFKLN
ncbi:M protein trans-acting positive regulator (MGA) [Clostridium perfringens]|uniref:helix-turn-helix domain-containing protein n=1 Tax=Clostridium perfringens TaxID=1502 RepID=UPI000D716887|nr:M protein trans-acting positive regulator (MGA) [Clostridium perfringens]